MQGRISQRPSFLILIARSSAGFLLILHAVPLSGCRREGAPPPNASGYVRLDALTGLHPAWSVVRQLDALLAHARNLKPTTTETMPSLPEIPLPAPLPVSQETNAGRPNGEQQRIESVRAPAEERVESLRNTLNAAVNRSVEAEDSRLRHEMEAALVQDEQRIQHDIAQARTAAEKKGNRELTDLGLRRIALQSQVEAYTSPLYPPEPRARIEKELAAVMLQIQQAEAKLAADLKAVDQRREIDLRQAKSRRKAQMQASLEQFRKEEQNAADSKVRSSRAEVGFVLNILEPLRPPQIRSTAPIQPLALDPPQRIAQETAAGMQNPLPISRSQRDIAAQRDRLVSFVTDDIKRRVQRLAMERGWQIAFAPSNGTDMTDAIAGILREEWKP